MRLFTYNVTLLVLLAAGSIIMRIADVISADAFWICACIEALIAVTMSNSDRGRKEPVPKRTPFDPYGEQKNNAGKHSSQCPETPIANPSNT